MIRTINCSRGHKYDEANLSYPVSRSVSSSYIQFLLCFFYVPPLFACVLSHDPFVLSSPLWYFFSFRFVCFFQFSIGMFFTVHWFLCTEIFFLFFFLFFRVHLQYIRLSLYECILLIFLKIHTLSRTF